MQTQSSFLLYIYILLPFGQNNSQGSLNGALLVPWPMAEARICFCLLLQFLGKWQLEQSSFGGGGRESKLHAANGGFQTDLPLDMMFIMRSRGYHLPEILSHLAYIREYFHSLFYSCGNCQLDAMLSVAPTATASLQP